MKNSANSQRGQALLILVFVILVLVLVTGLAIDSRSGCCIGPDRSPQNAADTAALGAALCRIHGKAPIPCAYQYAASNGYDSDLVSNQVDAYSCDMAQASCGPYAGNPDYVQVIITTYKEAFFTKLVGIRLREGVQALALAQQPDQVSLMRSDSPVPGVGRSWVFSAPPWVRFILQPTTLVLLFIFIIGVLMIAMPPLLKRRRA